MRREHTSLPTACHPHLSHPHSACGYWIRDITGYSICAYPTPYQVMYQLSVNLPNPLLLILCAPTTAIASQFTNSFVNKLPPFICFRQPLTKYRVPPSSHTAGFDGLSFCFHLIIHQLCKTQSFSLLSLLQTEDSQLLQFLLINASAPSF